MRSYLVLTPPGIGERDLEGTLVLRDGFSWTAFLFPWPWLLFNRLWLAGGTVLVFQLAALLLTLLPGLAAAGWLSLLAIHLLVALEARHYRSEALIRRGWALKAAIPAPDLDTAEEIWFSSLPEPAPQSIPAVREWAKRAGEAAASWQRAPLGLFDQQGNR